MIKNTLNIFCVRWNRSGFSIGIMLWILSGFLFSCDNNYDRDVSQSTNFVKVYGGSKMQKGNDIKITKDGDFLVLGSSNSFSTGGYDFYFLKTDAKGNEIWSKTYGGAKDDFGNSILITSQGNYLLLGTTTDDSNFTDVLLIMVNTNGEELWRRVIGEVSYNEYGYDLKEDLNGNGFIIIGHTNRLDLGKYPAGIEKPDTDVSDFFIFRTDLSGQVTQTRVLGVNGEDLGNGILPIRNANGVDEYLIIGTSTRYDESGSTNGSALQFFKSNINLGINMEHHVDGNRTGMAICEMDGGGYAIVGSAGSGSNGQDVLLVQLKIDNNNGISLLEEIIHNEGGDQKGKSILQLQDGSFIIFGTTTNFQGGESDLFLLKLDQKGQYLWSRNFGDEGSEQAGKVISTPDGGLVMIGTLYFGNNEMVYLIKTNAEGLLYDE